MRGCNFSFFDFGKQLIEFLLSDLGDSFFHDIIDGDLRVPVLVHKITFHLGGVEPVYFFLHCLGGLADGLGRIGSTCLRMAEFSFLSSYLSMVAWLFIIIIIIAIIVTQTLPPS